MTMSLDPLDALWADDEEEEIDPLDTLWRDPAPTTALPAPLEPPARRQAAVIQPEADPSGDWMQQTRAFADDWMRNPSRSIPFVGGAVDLAEMGDLLGIAHRARDGQASEEEMARLQSWADEQAKDKGTVYQILDTISEMPAFMGELWVTGGLYTGGRIAARKGALKVLRKVVQEGVKRGGGGRAASKAADRVTRYAANAVGATAGALVQAPVARATEIAAGTVRNLLPVELQKDEDGTVIAQITREDPEFEEAFLKSFGDQAVEVWSEKTGGAFTVLGRSMLAPLGKVGVFRALQKANPGKSVKEVAQFARRVGYDGILQEMGEERVGEAARAALGITDEWELPDQQQLLVELASFAIPSATFSAVSSVMRATQAEKATPSTMKERQDLIRRVAATGEKPTSFIRKHLGKKIGEVTREDIELADAVLRADMEAEAQEPEETSGTQEAAAPAATEESEGGPTVSRKGNRLELTYPGETPEADRQRLEADRWRQTPDRRTWYTSVGEKEVGAEKAAARLSLASELSSPEAGETGESRGVSESQDMGGTTPRPESRGAASGNVPKRLTPHAAIRRLGGVSREVRDRILENLPQEGGKAGQKLRRRLREMSTGQGDFETLLADAAGTPEAAVLENAGIRSMDDLIESVRSGRLYENAPTSLEDEGDRLERERAEEMEAAIARGEVDAPEVMVDDDIPFNIPTSSETFADQMQSAYNLERDEAETISILVDERAQVWAEQTGRSKDDWYSTRIAEIRRGESDSGAGQTRKRATLGSVQFLSDMRAVLKGFEGSDVSTALHEPAHIFRRDLYRSLDEASDEHVAQIEADIQAIEEWVGVTAGDSWNREQEEMWARGWERYARTGTAPNEKLETVFKRLKTWLTRIYQKVSGSDIDVAISPQVREVFGRMIDVEAAREVPLEQRRKPAPMRGARTDADGAIYIRPGSLTGKQVGDIARGLKERGWDIRGAKDLLELWGRRDQNGTGEVFIPKDQAGAIEEILGVTIPGAQKQSTEPPVAGDELAAAAVEHFGVTEDLASTGWITPDGQKIDLTAGQGRRVIDHRGISEVHEGLGQGTAAMQEALAAGMVRWIPEGQGMSIGAAPSAEQEGVIREIVETVSDGIYLDLRDGLGTMDEGRGDYYTGGRAFEQFYPEGTPASRIIADIRTFYRGESPRQDMGVGEFRQERDDDLSKLSDEEVDARLKRLLEQKKYGGPEFEALREESVRRFHEKNGGERKYLGWTYKPEDNGWSIYTPEGEMADRAQTEEEARGAIAEFSTGRTSSRPDDMAEGFRVYKEVLTGKERLNVAAELNAVIRDAEESGLDLRDVFEGLAVEQPTPADLFALLYSGRGDKSSVLWETAEELELDDVIEAAARREGLGQKSEQDAADDRKRKVIERIGAMRPGILNQERADEIDDADAAGATEKSLATAKRQWIEKGTQSPYFQRWWEGASSRLEEFPGVPRLLMHGTTHPGITSFNRDRVNTENFAGSAFYFTDSAADASGNYGGVGPDLRLRIDRRTDQIFDSDVERDEFDELNEAHEFDVAWYDENTGQAVVRSPEERAAVKAKLGLELGEEIPNDPDTRFKLWAEAKAKSELHGGAPNVMPVYVRMEKPLDFDNDFFWMMEDYRQYRDQFLDKAREQQDEYPGMTLSEIADEMAMEAGLEPARRGNVEAFAEALEQAADGFELVDDVDMRDAFYQAFGDQLIDGDGVPVEDVYQWVVMDSPAAEALDPNNDQAASAEIFRRAVEAAGYDGMIMSADRFRMDDVSGTTHYIAFRPEQIKSAIGNRGTFERGNPNILEQTREHEGELSTRMPSVGSGVRKRVYTDGGEQDAIANLLVSDYETSQQIEGWTEQTAELLKSYVNPTSDDKPAADVIEDFIEHVARNLVAAYHMVPKKMREKTRRWYDSANEIIVKQLVPKYQKTEQQIAGIIAVLSPQNEWGNNTAQAMRILDILTTKQDFAWSPEMTRTAERRFGKMGGASGKARDRLVRSSRRRVLPPGHIMWRTQLMDGLKLSELDDPVEKAIFIRAYDETYNDSRKEIFTLDGKIVKEEGGDAFHWNGTDRIAYAVSIFEDGSLENISMQMGGYHKIRNFHNNLLAPNSKNGHITIDTHAVAIGLMRALSASDQEVLNNFGGKVTGDEWMGPRNSAPHGISGTYGVYFEAYRRAFERIPELNHPRELQSVVWEAGRALFPDVLKKDGQTLGSDVDAIWARVAAGEIDEDQARNEIFSLARKENIRLINQRAANGDITREQAKREKRQLQQSLRRFRGSRGAISAQVGPGGEPGELRGAELAGQGSGGGAAGGGGAGNAPGIGPDELSQERLHPLEQRMLEEHGEWSPSQDVPGKAVRGPAFVLSDGRLVAYTSIHDQMIRKAGLELTREGFIDQSGAIRVASTPDEETGDTEAAFEIRGLNPTASQIREMARLSRDASVIRIDARDEEGYYSEEFHSIGELQRFFRDDMGPDELRQERSEEDVAVEAIRARRFPRSLQAAGLTGGNNLTYQPVTNDETADAVEKRIRESVEGTEKWLMDELSAGQGRYVPTEDALGAEHTAAGIALISIYQHRSQVAEQQGNLVNADANMQKAVDIAAALSSRLTRAGQFIQAASMVTRMSREGVVRWAQQKIDRINREAGSKAKPRQLEPQTARRLVDLADMAGAGTELRDDAQILADIMRDMELGGTLYEDEVRIARSMVERMEQLATSRGGYGGKKLRRWAAEIKAILDEATVVSAADYQLALFEQEQEVEEQDEALFQAKSLSDLGAEAFRLQPPKDGRPRRVTLSAQQAETLGMALGRAKESSGEVQEDLASEVAATIEALEKPSKSRMISTLQAMSHLLNPLTAVRNIGGNELFYRVERLNHMLSAGLDTAFTVAGNIPAGRALLDMSTRTISFSSAGQDGYWEGLLRGSEASLRGYAPGGIETRYDLASTPTFTGKYNPLTYLEKVMGVELRGFDYAAYNRARNKVLGEMAVLDAMRLGLKGDAQKKHVERFITNASKQAQDVAHAYGLYSTFQDDNALSKGAMAIKRALNAGKDFGMGDLVLKYPKTPSNLFLRGIEYSPVGYLRAATQLAAPFLKQETIDRREVTLALSRALVGTGISMLAMQLVAEGVLTGGDDDWAENAFLRNETGEGPYQVNVSAIGRWARSGFNPAQLKRRQNDLLYTYNWAMPLSLSIAGAANMQEAKSSKASRSLQGRLGTAAGSFVQGISMSMQELPTMQALTELAGGYGSSSIGTNFIGILEDLPAQFVPTFVNQLAKIQDNTVREKSSDPDLVSRMWNKAVDRLPFMRERLPAAYETLGINETRERYQGGSNSWVNVFLNPGFVSRYQPDPLALWLMDLEEQTGVRNRPQRIGRSFSLGKSYLNDLFQGDPFIKAVSLQFDDAERSRMQKIMAHYATQRLREKSQAELAQLTPDLQLAFANSALRKASQDTRKWFVKNRAADYGPALAEALQEQLRIRRGE